MENDDVMQIQLQELNAGQVEKWIERAKQILHKVEERFPEYKLKTVAVTVSANPSATVTFEKKQVTAAARKRKR